MTRRTHANKFLEHNAMRTVHNVYCQFHELDYYAPLTHHDRFREQHKLNITTRAKWIQAGSDAKTFSIGDNPQIGHFQEPTNVHEKNDRRWKKDEPVLAHTRPGYIPPGTKRSEPDNDQVHNQSMNWNALDSLNLL